MEFGYFSLNIFILLGAKMSGEFDAIRNELANKYYTDACSEGSSGNFTDDVIYSFEAGFDAGVKQCQAERDKLRAENENYRKAIDKITAGIPSEWAYAILRDERDKLLVEIEQLKKNLEA